MFATPADTFNAVVTALPDHMWNSASANPTAEDLFAADSSGRTPDGTTVDATGWSVSLDIPGADGARTRLTLDHDTVVRAARLILGAQRPAGVPDRTVRQAALLLFVPDAADMDAIDAEIVSMVAAHGRADL